jgi:hypothetical protein
VSALGAELAPSRDKKSEHANVHCGGDGSEEEAAEEEAAEEPLLAAAVR